MHALARPKEPRRRGRRVRQGQPRRAEGEEVAACQRGKHGAVSRGSSRRRWRASPHATPPPGGTPGRSGDSRTGAEWHGGTLNHTATARPARRGSRGLRRSPRLGLRERVLHDMAEPASRAVRRPDLGIHLGHGHAAVEPPEADPRNLRRDRRSLRLELGVRRWRPGPDDGQDSWPAGPDRGRATSPGHAPAGVGVGLGEPLREQFLVPFRHLVRGQRFGQAVPDLLDQVQPLATLSRSIPSSLMVIATPAPPSMGCTLWASYQNGHTLGSRPRMAQNGPTSSLRLIERPRG